VRKTSWKPRIDPKIYEKYYNMDLSDPVVVDKIRCTAPAVFLWRKRTGRPPNYQAKLKKLPVQFSVLHSCGAYDVLYLNHSIKDSLGWRDNDKFKIEINHDSVMITKVKN
jgi:hypothetical protein